MNERSNWIRILAYSGMAGLGGKLAQFLALTFLAYVLFPEDFGRFSIAQIVTTGLVSIVSSSFAIAANQQAALNSKSHHARPLVVTSNAVLDFRVQLALVLLCSAVGVPFLYSVLSGGVLEWWTIVWGALTTSIVLVDLVAGALAGSGAIRLAGLLDASRLLISGLAVLLLGMVFGFQGAVFGLVFFDSLLSLFFLIAAFRKRPGILRRLTPHSFRTIRAGLVSNGVTQITSWTLTWALQFSFGLAAVGAFAFTNRFASLILIVPGLLSKNSLGLLSRTRQENLPKASRSAGIYLGLTALLSLLATMAVLVLIVFFAKGLSLPYEDFWTLLWVLLAASIFRALATSLGVVCVAWGMIKTWVHTDVVAALVSALWVVFTIVFDMSLVWMVASLLLSATLAFLLRSLLLLKSTTRSPRTLNVSI